MLTKFPKCQLRGMNYNALEVHLAMLHDEYLSSGICRKHTQNILIQLTLHK